jgi:hypothetical protein
MRKLNLQKLKYQQQKDIIERVILVGAISNRQSVGNAFMRSAIREEQINQFPTEDKTNLFCYVLL